MPPTTPPTRSVFRAVDPRPLFPAERQLLDALTAGIGAEAGRELTAQIDGGTVVGTCSCGCSSVRLTTSAEPLPPATLNRLSGTGRTEHLAVSSTGRGPAGQVVSVTLHVVEGRLHELEVFDADAGEGTAVAASAVTALSPPTVG